MNIPNFRDVEEMDDSEVMCKLMETFVKMTGSSGFLVAITDMDGRPWLVTSACREEIGVDSIEMLTEAVMKVVYEHWPPDDQVQTYVRNDAESTKANIIAHKARMAQQEFDANPLKS
jgi:pyruvate carboxylase